MEVVRLILHKQRMLRASQKLSMTYSYNNKAYKQYVYPPYNDEFHVQNYTDETDKTPDQDGSKVAISTPLCDSVK